MAFYGLPLTERQELFCRHVARGASAAAAARAAGYAPGNAAHQGAALLTKPQVRRRVEELRLRREGTRRIAITEMVDMLRTILQRALEKGELRTALRCVEVEARLCGLFPDRLSHEFAACDPLLDGVDPRGPMDAPMDLQEPPFDGAPEPDPQPEAGAAPEIRAGVDGTPMTPHQSPSCSPSVGPDSPRNPQEPPSPAAAASAAALPAMVRGPRPATSGAQIAGMWQALEAERLRHVTPPRADDPLAPGWARDPDPLVRAAGAAQHGWRDEWVRGGGSGDAAGSRAIGPSPPAAPIL